MALSHLRDVVHLRAMALGETLLPDVSRTQRGWELSRYLLDAVNRLRPSQDDRDAWPRRRYDILMLRYVNGLSPDQVADRLAVSRRHFYRQLQRALDELADFLWLEVSDQATSMQDARLRPLPEQEKDAHHLALLRSETAPLLRSRQSSSVPEVCENALRVLDPLLEERSISLRVDLAPGLPEVSLSPGILRQFLLGLLGDLLACQATRTISISARPTQDGLELALAAQQGPPPAGERARPCPDELRREAGRKASAQLATLSGARLQALEAGPDGTTLRVLLPIARSRTILVVDDNEEVCRLFARYLASGGYGALLATSAAEAISLARSCPLYAVILDLMMSEEDGWDVLQALTHDPQTSHLPVIVCTVLDHEELALMLGATAFLKKPVMREQLLQALADIKPAHPQAPAQP